MPKQGRLNDKKARGGRSFSRGIPTDHRYAYFGGIMNVCGCGRSSDIFLASLHDVSDRHNTSNTLQRLNFPKKTFSYDTNLKCFCLFKVVWDKKFLNCFPLITYGKY